MATKCKQGSVVVKTVVAIVLAALVGAAFLWMSQEQQARAASQDIYAALEAVIDDGLTPEQVHKRLGRNPNQTREPFKHRLVEEYTFRGPLQSHTVYAYYNVAATKFLVSVTINAKSEKWESETAE